MALVNTLGMGMLLRYDVKGITEMRSAERHLRKLKEQSAETFKAIEKQADKLRTSMDRYKTRFKTSMKVAGAGVILAAPFAYATKEAIKFDDQIGKIRGLLTAKGLFGDDADKAAAKLGDAILAVGNNSRQSQELITAASYAVLSGLEDWEAVGPALQRAADLATAANGNIESSSESLLNTMNTFGVRWAETMTPVEMTDRIFTTLTNAVGQANTDINKLNGAMVYATPIANLMGQSFEGTATAVGLLQTKGLGGQLAGTAFNATMRGLIMLTTKFKDKTVQAKSAAMSMTDFLQTYESAKKTGGLERTTNPLAGLEFMDESGRMKEVWEIVADLERVFDLSSEKAEELGNKLESNAITGAEAFDTLGMSVDDVSSMQQALGDEGMRALALWIGQSEALKANAEAAGDVIAADEALASAQDTTAGKIDMLKNRLGNLSKTIGSGTTPVVDAMAVSLLDMTDAADEFFKTHPTAAAWISWGGAVGGTLFTIGGSVGSLFFSLKILQTQMTLTRLMGGDTVGIFAKIGHSTAILRVRLLALALGQWILTAATTAWAFVTGVASGALGFLNAILVATPIGWIILGIVALIASLYVLIFHWDWVKEVASDAWAGIVDGLKWVWGKLKWFGGVVADLWEKMWPILKWTPLALAIQGMIISVKWLLGALGLLDGGTEKRGGDLADRETGGPGPIGPYMEPATLSSGTLIFKPEKLGPSSTPTSNEDISDLKTAPAQSAASAGTHVVQHNTFHINGKEKTSKETARETQKRLENLKLRSPDGKRG